MGLWMESGAVTAAIRRELRKLRSSKNDDADKRRSLSTLMSFSTREKDRGRGA
jgi:hypothetical protein